MRVQVQKWGNSLALRIPKSFAIDSKIESGSTVELNLVDGKLVITPLSSPGRTLSELLADVNEENLHGELDTGTAVGGEVW